MSDNTVYVARPKGKPDMTTKGKLNEWSNGYREFIPQGTRENQREMLKQLGDSSFYPVGELLDQFLVLTESERKQLPKLPEGSEGRMLLDNGQGLQIWLDRDRGKISILAELDCDSNIERMLLQTQSQMNVCIARNRTEILNYNKNKNNG